MPAERNQAAMEEVRRSWDRNPMIFACGVVGIGIVIALIAYLTRKHRRPRHVPPQTSGGAVRHWPMPRPNCTKLQTWKAPEGVTMSYSSFRGEGEKDLEAGLEWERETCAICLEEIQDVELVRKLKCEHVFHSECAAKWYCCDLQTCPVCRRSEKVKGKEERKDEGSPAPAPGPPV